MGQVNVEQHQEDLERLRKIINTIWAKAQVVGETPNWWDMNLTVQQNEFYFIIDFIDTYCLPEIKDANLTEIFNT